MLYGATTTNVYRAALDSYVAGQFAVQDDWINELEEYFEYEDIEDPNKVKLSKAKLKGHTKIKY